MTCTMDDSAPFPSDLEREVARTDSKQPAACPLCPVRVALGLPERDPLPQSIRGLDPDYTGGLDVAEYVRQRWAGDVSAPLREDDDAAALTVARPGWRALRFRLAQPPPEVPDPKAAERCAAREEARQ